jgi:hypothetical protein
MKALLLLALWSPAARAECEGFDFVAERDGVRVYNRKIDGSAVRELCATMQLEAPPAQVYTMLRERQLPPTVDVEHLAHNVYYMIIDPGFISRRDYCLQIDGSRDGDAYVIKWDMVDCPRRNLMRMVTNRGFWRITPRGTGSSILYHTHADPGGLVPPWIVNAASARRLPEILGALKR